MPREGVPHEPHAGRARERPAAHHPHRMDPRRLPLPVILGAATGLLVFLVTAFDTLLNLIFHPRIVERATPGAYLALLAYAVLFVAAGGTCGYLWGIRSRFLRYVLTGGIAGAVVWSYLTAAWPLTGKTFGLIAPTTGVPSAALAGAVLGAGAGLLLYVIDRVRR
jgi:hypothetical protein